MNAATIDTVLQLLDALEAIGRDYRVDYYRNGRIKRIRVYDGSEREQGGDDGDDAGDRGPNGRLP